MDFIKRKSYFNKIHNERCNYNPDSTHKLLGLSETEIYTKGSFTTVLKIDDCHFDVTFLIVDDNAISVNKILGNPILNEVEINFKGSAISAKRILHLSMIDDHEKIVNIGDMRYKD